MITKENLMQIVGNGQVSQEAAVLDSYARDMSFVNAIKPSYVVKPQTGQIVQSLVKLANETGTPLVPVSSGPPHFRGDTVPSVGGAVVVNSDALAERIGYLQNALGTCAAPLDCFLVLRGIKTLAVRMEEHNRNALEIAHWLERHKKISAVLHPGLSSHPQHDLALRDAGGDVPSAAALRVPTQVGGASAGHQVHLSNR